MAKLNFDKEASVIVLDVEIKFGSKIIDSRMVLDTGSTYVTIPWRIADVLGLDPNIAKEKVDSITASKVESSPVMAVDSIKVLGKEFKNVKVIMHDLPQKSYVDGLLGLSFLRNFNIKIYFKQGILEID